MSIWISGGMLWLCLGMTPTPEFISSRMSQATSQAQSHVRKPLLLLGRSWAANGGGLSPGPLRCSSEGCWCWLLKDAARCGFVLGAVSHLHGWTPTQPPRAIALTNSAVKRVHSIPLADINMCWCLSFMKTNEQRYLLLQPLSVHGSEVCRQKQQLPAPCRHVSSLCQAMSDQNQPLALRCEKARQCPRSPLKRSRRKDWLRCKRGSSAHKAFPAGVPVGCLPANPAAAAAFPGPPETLGEFPLQLFSGGICVSHQPWMPQGMVPKNQQLGSFSTWTQEIYSGLSVPSASHRCSSGRRGEEKGTWGHQNWTESVL